MIKMLIIFIIGLLEQLLYTSYLVSINKKQVYKSTILMMSYMSIYLFIISYAIKDTNTVPLLLTYTFACGIGNYCIMRWENRK
jgi:uncharacterized protein YebE (UPF0316 family)